MTPRKIHEIKNLSADSEKLYEVLNSERDLSAILVGTSYIDACLGSILNLKLLKSSVTKRILDSRSGILGTFSARADLCYVLSLINKSLYKDLTIIASIRNVVAHHHMEVDFNNEEIASLCNKLNYLQSLEDKPVIIGDWFHDNPRNQFMISAVTISNRLLLIGLGLERSSDSSNV